MTREETLYCMKANSVLHSETCEECPFYRDTGVDHCFEDALDEVIKTLEQELCDDVISRQEAVGAFQMFREYESNRSNKEWVDRIETVLNQLPSVNPQPKTWHWIPVSERLPEESGRYLAYIINKHENKLQYIMTCDYSVDGYWNWFPDDECASDNVIAWMPLPQPYEPQERNSEE